MRLLTKRLLWGGGIAANLFRNLTAQLGQFALMDQHTASLYHIFLQRYARMSIPAFGGPKKRIEYWIFAHEALI